MESPKISVVIPTFNRPDFLEKAVQSVLAQTYPAHEIIIIDDGSDSIVKDRIKNLVKFENTISIYYLPSNKGVSAARNFGLGKANGDYILFLDDDDLIHPEMLKSNLAVFEQSEGIDVVTCLSKIFFHNLSKRSMRLGGKKLHADPSKFTYPANHPDELKLKHITFSRIMLYTLTINSCLVRKDCIKNICFPEDLKAGEDTYFWLSLALQGCKFKLNEQYYSYVCLHANNTRWRDGYNNDVISFFNKLLSGGMLRNRHDFFITHVLISLKLFKMKRLQIIKYLLLILKSPDLILKYLYLYFSKESRRKRNLYKMHKMPYKTF